MACSREHYIQGILLQIVKFFDPAPVTFNIAGINPFGLNHILKKKKKHAENCNKYNTLKFIHLSCPFRESAVHIQLFIIPQIKNISVLIAKVIHDHCCISAGTGAPDKAAAF